jgi:hypothetical protein
LSIPSVDTHSKGSLSVRESLSILCEPGAVYELRAFGRNTHSGYFNDLDKLAAAADRLSGHFPAVYITANPVQPDLLARAENRVRDYVGAGDTTPDALIVKRRWLPVDFDAQPAHKYKVSSTDSEHQVALDRARECREWLCSQGWPDPVYASSGNGGHLLYRIDLPNDDASRDLLKDCLLALSLRFSDAAAEVDPANYNAARIWKVYSTVVAKGDSIAERPHRIARILEIPDSASVVPVSLLQALADEVPQQEPSDKRTYRGNGGAFNLDRWIVDHDVQVHHTSAWNSGQRWVLEQCPWNEDHTDLSAYIVQLNSGGIGAGCHHSGCTGKGWPDLRAVFEPGYRGRKHSNGHTAENVDYDNLEELTYAETRSPAPPFPDLAWHPLLAEGRDWISPCTSAAFEWIFSAVKAVVELVIGPRVYVQMGREVRANSFQLNIGPPSEKKGTPLSLVSSKLIRPHGDLFGLTEDNFEIVRGTGSAEGLLQAFMYETIEMNSRGQEISRLTPAPGRRILNVEEEFGNLLTKAHSTATQNLRDIICQLWDGEDVSPRTRKRSIKAIQPFYSLLTMTTAETLSSRMLEDDILSGLMTRAQIYQGTLRPPKAWPKAPDRQAALNLAAKLTDLNNHVQIVAANSPCIEASPAADAAWEAAHTVLYENSRKAGTPALGDMLSRIPIHAIKFALTHAMMSHHERIETDDLAPALALADYWAKTVHEIAGAELGGDDRKVEFKIMRVAENNPGRPIDISDLHKKVSGRIKAKDFHAAVLALIGLGRLDKIEDEEDGRLRAVVLARH